MTFNKGHIEDQSRLTRPPIDPHIPYWLLSGGTVTDEGGLNITWTGGQVMCPVTGFMGRFDAQTTNHALTDDAINYLYYAHDRTLGTKTTHPIANHEVEIAIFWCANGDIIRLHQDVGIASATESVLRGLAEVFPAFVTFGLIVSEEAGGANLDLTQTAGRFHV